MNKYYLAKVQYVGARYHGWQKQKDVATVHEVFDQAMIEALPGVECMSMGASRTDARVNALGQVVKITLYGENLEPSILQEKINEKLPFDIRITNIIRTQKVLKVIRMAKDKEYLYLFSKGPNASAFLYPYVVNFEEELNLEKMQEAAKLFLGEHDFKNYCYRGEHVKETTRKIFECEIIEHHELSLDGVAIKSHALKIRGNGFLKQMVRIIMGALVEVGIGNVTYEQVKESLRPESSLKLGFISPPHGLFLHFIKYPNRYMDKELD